MTLICKGSQSGHPAVPPAVNPGIAPLRLLARRFAHMWSFMTSIGIQVFIKARKCGETHL